MRLVPLAGAVMLVVSLFLYEDPIRGGSEVVGPLDPTNIRVKMWFEPLLASDWAAMINTVAALVYGGFGFALLGRMRWRSVVRSFVAAAGLALAALASLVYLMVTDSATFPVTYGGMAAVLLSHVVGAGGLTLTWWILRRAAKA